MVRARVSLAVAVLVVSIPMTARSATYTVNPTSDADCSDFDCDLGSALIAASSNAGADTIAIAAGSYDVSSSTPTYLPGGGAPFGSDASALTIQGAGAGVTVLDGGAVTRVLTLDTTNLGDDSVAHLTIRGMTLRHGNVTSSDNNALGGGLYARALSANIVVENCTFATNAVAASSSGVIEAAGGGAWVATYGNVTFTGNTFTANTATASTLADGARVIARGGGAHAEGWGTVLLDGNSFTGNSATVHSSHANTNLWALAGGCEARNDAGDVVATDNLFADNVAASDDRATNGGGAYFVASTITSERDTFRGNSATAGGDGGSLGGGLCAVPWTSMTVVNDSFLGNHVSGVSGVCGGGAALLGDAAVTFTNNTLTANTSSGEGGGLCLTAPENGGVVNIYNNVLWGNTASAGGDDGDDLAVKLSPATVNLYSNALGANSDVVTGFSEDLLLASTSGYSQGNNLTADPRLDTDGFLQFGSPCIDSGDGLAPSAPSDDIQGDTRPFDGDGVPPAVIDRGADEYTGPATLPPVPVFAPVGLELAVLLLGLAGALALLRRD